MDAVLPGPGRPRDLLVRHVPDQGVPEGELALPLDARPVRRADQLPAGQLPQGRGHRAGVPVSHRLECPGPEFLPYHRGVLEHGLGFWAELVQPGRDQGLDRVGEPDVRALGQGPRPTVLNEEALILQHADELLCVQGVAAGPLEEQGLDLGREDLLPQEGGHQAGRVRVG